MAKSKTTKVKTTWVGFSCLKASEGGTSKKDILMLLKNEGIHCKAGGYTPYVGHYSILVDERDEKRASDLLWGPRKKRWMIP